MKNRMKNQTTHFLKISLMAIILLSALVFMFIAVYMNWQSANTISQVGALYMSEMSEQISLHFQTTVGMRLSQLEALCRTIPPDASESFETMRDDLTYNARARDFDALALYMPDQSFEMLYGVSVQLADPESFYRSIADGRSKVAVGTDADGEMVVLFGTPAAYRSSGGEASLALVGILPSEYITSTLELDKDGDMQMDATIIRRDGSYIIRMPDGLENYFEHVNTTVGEKHAASAQQYITELTDAMNGSGSFSGVLTTDAGRQHAYCSALPYSEWYLVIVMTYGQLDKAVNQLGIRWVTLAITGFAILFVALLLIFAKYYSLTGQQIRELDKARGDAIRANQAKSEFLSNMSHDIRTPMNAIVGMTAIATANIDNQDQVKNCLRKITLSSKHLLGLINDILDMSKIESGKMTLNIDQVSLREVMDSIVNIVQPQIRAKKLHFDVIIQDIEVENVCCDSVRLNQVLLNFLSNAVKFTPEGGHIEIAMDEEPSPKGGDYIRVHFRVKDDGIGMSPEFQKIIFESFAREDSTRVHKTEGTGLGMAITKYIVDMMEGTIELDSEKGKGTEFRVALDFEKATVTEAEMILPGWSMLVVDDDEILCESTVTSLRQIGIQAEWTLDAESAIHMIEKRHKAGQGYQIILLDWKLPGMDGIAAAKEIRARVGGEMPILLISAYDWSEIENEARSAGVTGFIAKPLFKSTLYYGLKKYTGEDDRLEERPEEEQVSFAGRRVLVAEDNELNWEIASELLSETGMELEWAEDGKICLDKFAASPIGYYDAILMDLRMPVMMGYEATERIRALPREDASLPIIAMTADAFSEDVKKCLDCGMNAHIAKPIDIKDVTRILSKFLFSQTTVEKGR